MPSESVSSPWIVAMFGWFTAASASASLRKRASASASPAISRGSILSATSRSRRGSRPSQTWPIPPAPSCRTTT